MRSLDADGPQRVATDRLDQRRYVVAGDHAYLVGTTDGRFPPLGQKIAGLMGGIWTSPIKLLDGYWFAIDDAWLPPAQRFITGAGYVQMQFPNQAGLAIRRTEFAPDGLPALLCALTLCNLEPVERDVQVTLEAQSEIMGAYPWDSSTPTAKECNGKDTVSQSDHGNALIFAEPDKPWYAIIGASQPAVSRDVGAQFWGPVSEAERAYFREHGNGTGGQLRWSLHIAGESEYTLWVAVAGSHLGIAQAESALASALAGPERLLHEKIKQRHAVLDQNQILLPETALVDACDWGKLNMADMRRTVAQMHVRDVKEGKEYPPPIATLPSVRGINDGYPDYTNFYGTGSGYIVYPMIASGMWEDAMQHLRTLRDVSRIINKHTGKVVHEIVSDGSVYFGDNSAPGDTNETPQFATAVDLLWCWSGDDAFRDEMYDFIVDGMRYITTDLDHDGDGWPTGAGIAERPGMGREQLDVTADTWEGLRALAHMASAKGDTTTASWAHAKAKAMQAAFDDVWWMEEESLYADSRCHEEDIEKANEQDKPWTNACAALHQKLQQHLWISVAPLKTMLAPKHRAHTVLNRMETPTFTAPSGGVYLVGEGGGPDGKAIRQCWTIVTGVLAIAESNYGRLGEHQALRYMRAIAACLDVEMPGALPEVMPGQEYDTFTDLCERFMVMQAWASFGINWTVVHNFLGLRPDMPARRLTVIPQVPPSWPGLSARNMRVGRGAIDVKAERAGQCYTTTVTASPDWRLTLGHTLPPGSQIETVTLDGAPLAYAVVDTARGREVRVETTTGQPRTLVITVK